MTLGIALFIVFLLVLVTRRYRGVFSVAVAAIILAALPTAALLWGRVRFSEREVVSFFYASIDRLSFHTLIAAWYAADAIAAGLIVRSYLAYLKVNRPNRNAPPSFMEESRRASEQTSTLE